MNKESKAFCLRTLKSKEIKKTRIINCEIFVEKYSGRIVDAEKFYKPITKII